MDARFSLRFESGERRGETIQVTDGGFTIGRRPGNSLQVLDNSISGRHAEFLIDEQGVTVKDLGSTNGTRVGDTRVLEQRITHGDHVTLGNVEFIRDNIEYTIVAIVALSLTPVFIEFYRSRKHKHPGTPLAEGFQDIDEAVHEG